MRSEIESIKLVLQVLLGLQVLFHTFPTSMKLMFFFPIFMATFPLFAKFHRVLLAYGELETDW